MGSGWVRAKAQRHCLSAVTFLLGLALAQTGYSADFMLLSRAEATAIKRGVREKKPSLMAAAEKLRHEADVRMKRGPWSVTFHRPKGTPAGPHDFFSEAPYWWPNPANPNGPYLRRDGQVNPDRFVDNDRDMRDMSETVLALGAAAWLFDEPSYADRAANIISVWFIDEATRMNPHLEYGQAIRNINTGRGTGIIDSVPLIFAVQGMAFLDETGRWSPRDRAAAIQWFGDYLEWLARSEKGIEEKKSGNNHSTWYAAQVAIFSLYAWDDDNEAMAWDMFRNFLVPVQIRPDGSCPKEESRTKSLGYSSMNLNGLTILCRLAERQSIDLWHFRTAEGAGIEKSVAYLAPFIREPRQWKHEQIVPFNGGNSYFLALAGLSLNVPEYLEIYQNVAKPGDPWMILVDLLVHSSDRQHP